MTSTATPASASGWPLWWRSALLCGAVALLNLMVWQWANPPLPAAAAQLPVAGLAYNAFQRWQSPLDRQWPAAQEVSRDLAALARLTPRLRTYSSSEIPALGELTRAHGIRLTAGVWLDTQAERNEQEIRAIEEAILADRVAMGSRPTAGGLPDEAGPAAIGRAIERVIAGNETQLHKLLPPEALMAILDRLRLTLDVPVSTAEPWHVWLAQPELVEHVDFIAVHLLPYWEGVPAEVAVHEVWRRYEEVRQRYPDKPVVIAEVGWPSGGPEVEKRVHGALNRAGASPLEQARFLREFVASAQRRSTPVDYFLMEAIDQPWKVNTEGSVGSHWGVLDARREPKFSWSGPVERDPYWRGKAMAACGFGLLVLWPFLMRFSHMRASGRWAFGISSQAVSSLVVVLATLPLVDYLQVLDALLMALLAPALLLMAAILLAHAFEFSELFWEGSLRHRAPARALEAGEPCPLVSVHLACCNEPADMVLATLRSLQALDWPHLEILVVDNNSGDPACWQPVQAYVAQQRAAGDGRVRFIHLPKWPGYKAGALNEALRQTDPGAQWVAVVDADYVVDPNWIRRLAGWFQDPGVAVVQSPQAHRGWEGDRLARMMNWEYEGFFRLGMHHRHERNAIVQHGTMTLVRASALREAGGWSGESLCEDSELGLRLLRQGARLVYVDSVLGAGLVPQDFEACRRQRRRWAQGAMQILRRHRDALLGRSPLTVGQRYHFLAGWLPWIGDALNLGLTLAAMACAVGVLAAPTWVGPPLLLFALPLAAVLGVRVLLAPLLYHRRVGCTPADTAGAALVGLGLSHAIATGMIAGLVGQRGVFEVTRKATTGAERRSPDRGVREERMLLAGLLVCLLGLLADTLDSGRRHDGWMLLLGLQCLP